MTRVLVLGSSGRVGKMLRHVWEAGCAVPQMSFVYQTRLRGQSDDVLWDVTGPVPDEVLAAGPFDCLLVLSGVVPRAGADLSGNVDIGLASVDAAARLGIGTVLLASSSAVYGMQSDAPYSEEDVTEPANDYGHAKLKMEQLSAARAQAHGVDLCCLRIGNVTGADALMLNGAALKTDETLRIDQFADGGTPLRSYIGPATLAQVLCSLIDARDALPQTLNIAAPVPVEMAQLARAAEMPFDHVPASAGGHQHITLDCAALAALHPFALADSDPAEMVAQWRASRQG